MLEQQAVALPYGAFYTTGGVGQTGLTVTCTVRKLFAGTTLVSGAAATEVGGGLYRYTLAANLNDAEDIYVALFHTATTTVDCQDMEADYAVGKAGIEDLDAAISSRLATGGYTTPPTVGAIRTEMDTNSVRLDATVSSRLATSGYTTPPTVGAIRADLDTNSTRLAHLQADLAATPPTAAQVRSEMDLNSTRLAHLQADLSATPPTKEQIDSQLTNTHGSGNWLTGNTIAPDNAGIAAIEAKTNNLPADPASNTQVNTRLATSGYTAPDNTGVAAIKAKTDNLPSDPASNTQVNTRLATSGYTVPPTAAAVSDAVWDEATADHQAAGSEGKAMTDAAAGGGAGLANTILATQVPGGFASGSAGYLLGGLGAADVAPLYVTPRARSGVMNLIRGDDYKAAEGRAVTITDTGNLWPNLTGTVAYKVGALNKACTIVVATGTGKQIQLELTAAETSALSEGTYQYAFVATETNGDIVSLETGTLTVQEEHS